MHLYYICRQTETIMDTLTVKKPATFRLPEGLLAKLKTAAKKENRSLNNYVECLLMDAVYDTPNETTIRAIEEARHTKDKKGFDSVESLMEELMK